MELLSVQRSYLVLDEDNQTKVILDVPKTLHLSRLEVIRVDYKSKCKGIRYYIPYWLEGNIIVDDKTTIEIKNIEKGNSKPIGINLKEYKRLRRNDRQYKHIWLLLPTI